MFDRSRRDSRGPDSDIPRSPAPAPGKSTLTAGLAPAPATGPVQLSPAAVPAPVTEPAKVAGPNKNTTIYWDDPPVLYGIAGGDKTALRTLYHQHLREHMAAEPRMIELGFQALAPSEVGARPSQEDRDRPKGRTPGVGAHCRSAPARTYNSLPGT